MVRKPGALPVEKKAGDTRSRRSGDLAIDGGRILMVIETVGWHVDDRGTVVGRAR
ncbi:MAG TPA: hypothetical protein VIO16_11525 [Dehalococcoidia bacterium]